MILNKEHKIVWLFASFWCSHEIYNILSSAMVICHMFHLPPHKLQRREITSQLSVCAVCAGPSIIRESNCPF